LVRNKTKIEAQGIIIQDTLAHNGSRIITLSCDAVISELVAVMARENIRSVMLTDPAGRLTGIVSEHDLVRALAQNDAAMANITAQQLMTNEVVACHSEVGIEIALGLMSTNQIRHLPIVDDDWLLGIISIRDILDVQ
jgi:CBS domain-containing protein